MFISCAKLSAPIAYAIIIRSNIFFIVSFQFRQNYYKYFNVASDISKKVLFLNKCILNIKNRQGCKKHQEWGL